MEKTAIRDDFTGHYCYALQLIQETSHESFVTCMYKTSEFILESLESAVRSISFAEEFDDDTVRRLLSEPETASIMQASFVIIQAQDKFADNSADPEKMLDILIELARALQGSLDTSFSLKTEHIFYLTVLRIADSISEKLLELEGIYQESDAAAFAEEYQAMTEYMKACIDKLKKSGLMI